MHKQEVCGDPSRRSDVVHEFCGFRLNVGNELESRCSIADNGYFLTIPINGLVPSQT